MKIKIQNPTPDGGTLCVSCRHGTVINFRRGKDTIIDCQMLGSKYQVPEYVADCSSYDDRRSVGVRDMKQIAWILRTEKGGSKMGFTPYKDLKQDDKFHLSEEE